MRSAPILIGSIVCLLFAAPAWAKDKDNGHGHGHESNIAVAQGKARVFVTERDRSAVYTFYRTEYVGGRCPPGLDRRDIGCLPPGQAKRLWAIGAATADRRILSLACASPGPADTGAGRL